MGLHFTTLKTRHDLVVHNPMNFENGIVWLIYRVETRDQRNIWHLQGTATSEGIAVSMALSEVYFIGPVPLNTLFPEQPISWPGAYFPLDPTRKL